MKTDAELMDSIANSQRIAQRIGANRIAIDVLGWAVKHALAIPAPALKELMDMITGSDK